MISASPAGPPLCNLLELEDLQLEAPDDGHALAAVLSLSLSLFSKLNQQLPAAAAVAVPAPP